MNKKGILVLGWLLAAAGVASAEDGRIDRSADVARYISIMQSGRVGDAAIAARRIYTSGISDPALAAAINARLIAEDRTISGEKEHKDFCVFMVRALASAGNVDYADALKTMRKQTRNSKISSTIDDELPQLKWYQAKNAVTASSAGHQAGEDPEIAGLVNLINSDDYSFKHWGAERMYWDRNFDPRLMETLAPQVRQFVAQATRIEDAQQDDTMALFVRLLGYSKNAQYGELLASVEQAPNASPGIRKHAHAAQEVLKKTTL